MVYVLSGAFDNNKNKICTSHSVYYALYSILIATLPGIPRFMTLKSLVELLDDSYVRRRTYVNS